MTFIEIFLSVIASAGGLGTITWLFIKLISKYVVEDLNKKYQLCLEKELEDYKKKLELEKSIHSSVLLNKTYITKAKFDIEIEIYRELSKAFMIMAKTCSFLFTDDYFYYDKKRPKDFWIKKSVDAIQAVDTSQNILYQNSAFISEEIYNGFECILTKCQDIVLALEPLAHEEGNSWNEGDKTKYIDSHRSLAREILKDQENINKKLRTYLNSLDVI